jgi:hypothetical protein
MKFSPISIKAKPTTNVKKPAPAKMLFSVIFF